jgi:hypothetical protein
LREDANVSVRRRGVAILQEMWATPSVQQQQAGAGQCERRRAA